MEPSQEWWQQETDLKPEDIVDIVKTDPKIDEWRKSLIEELSADRLAAALKEESERLTALQVAGIVEKGLRWDATLQRDVLQRVRREIRRSLIFQRFREELKAKLTNSKVREELKQLCASCLLLKESFASFKNVDDTENISISSCKEVNVDSKVSSNPSEEEAAESSSEVFSKPHSPMEVEKNELQVVEMESDDWKPVEDQLPEDSDMAEMSESVKDKHFVNNNQEIEGGAAEVTRNAEILNAEHAKLSTNLVEKPNDFDIFNDKQQQEILVGNASKPSKVSRKVNETTEKELNAATIDQGVIAQSLGNKMIGRKVKLLRFTDKGQMKWISAQVLEYEGKYRQHKIRTEHGDEEWVAFSDENILLSK